ncbi:MAG: amidohydrolase family protein [Treponema sp.]|jgi:predicted TIM-barrel fold metal-dependent hydrolase|nr:amidohydrolase family protein [Treponema sp.]
MVIDCHTHIYPEKIAAKAVSNIENFYIIPMQGKGTVSDLLECSKRGGIDQCIVFSAASVPGQVVSINNYIASVCAEHPEFIGFGSLHADMENPGEEIERLISLGLKGIKLHPDMQKFNIDCDKMMDIYAMLEGRLPVIFHTGDYRYPYSHPARLARVIDAFPRLITVATHFGGWSIFDLALEYFQNRFCYMDVSSAIPFLGQRRAEELIGIYGAERFLFGSDYPMWDPGAELQRFHELNLMDQDKELILYRNAQRFLGLTD